LSWKNIYFKNRFRKNVYFQAWLRKNLYFQLKLLAPPDARILHKRRFRNTAGQVATLLAVGMDGHKVGRLPVSGRVMAQAQFLFSTTAATTSAGRFWCQSRCSTFEKRHGGRLGPPDEVQCGVGLREWSPLCRTYVGKAGRTDVR
jgi:hypothetical protein